MISSQSALIGTLILASAIYSATAISCYQCNSAENPECDTLDVRRPDMIAQFFQKCDEFAKYNGSIPFCRKTDLAGKLNFLEGDMRRTVRSCGWVKVHERVACYKADNDDHLETVCQCFEDGCNGAPSIGGQRQAVAVTVVATTLAFVAGATRLAV